MADAVAAGNGSLVTSPAGTANGARGKGGNRAAGSIEKDADSPRLFVGQIGNRPNEAELKKLFEDVGEVAQFHVLKDKKTKQSKGCCFVTYRTRADADKAISLLHEKHIIAPSRKPLVIQYAGGELERIENKLFVGSLPREMKDPELKTLFSQFGTVKEISVPRQQGGTANKGYGFVKMSVKAEAAKAIEGLHEKHTLPGQKKPMVVKWADTDEARAQRLAAKQGAPFGSPVQGGFPMGPNMGMGMGMGMGGGFSPMRPQGGPFSPQPMMGFSIHQQQQQQQQQQQPQQQIMGGGPSPGLGGFGTLPSQGFIGLLASNSPLNFNTRPGLLPGPGPNLLSSFGVNPLQQPQQQQPPQTQGLSSPGPSSAAPSSQAQPIPGFVNRVPGPTPPAGLPATASAAQVVATVGGAQGTPGASLFVYHLPAEFRDNDLLTTFSPFGNLVNAKVFIDQNSGESKGFGTVSYDTPEAAEAAASVLDGFALGGKTLKVQVKKEAPKPY